MTTTESTVDRTQAAPEHRRATMALRAAASLWFIWGVFHLAAGAAVVVFLAGEHPDGELQAIPGVLEVDFFGVDSTFASIANMQQHGYNLAWIGVVVTIASFWVWRGNRLAVATCVVLGGLADLGYFVFVDLAGYADPPGPQMTWIMAAAIILAGYAWMTTNQLQDLHRSNRTR